jgi:hypothetical protein
LFFRVELNYIGTSFGNLPSFSQFAERLAERSQRNFDHQHSIVEQSSGEITTVKWQQKIHQPNVILNFVSFDIKLKGLVEF